MTLVRIESGLPGYKSNALPLSQRVYSLTQLSEIGYKPIAMRKVELSAVIPSIMGSTLTGKDRAFKGRIS